MVEMIYAGLSQLRYGVVQMRQEGLCQGEPVGDYVGGQELLLVVLLVRAGMTGCGRYRRGGGGSHGMEKTAQVEGPAAEGGSRRHSRSSSTCSCCCWCVGRHRILVLELTYACSRRSGSLVV